MKNFNQNIKIRYIPIVLLTFFLLTSCQEETLQENIISNNKNQKQKTNPNETYAFSGTVYDISAAPDGSIMVAVNGTDSKTIQVIKNGQIKTMTSINSVSNIQGIASIGSGNAFVTTGGTDLAQNGELYKISNGNAKIVANLAAFEHNNDPDAFEGLQWKNQLCEAIDGFSAGPQNNPYKVTTLDEETVLVADAAGNTILYATSEGEVDYKAILSPPLNEEGNHLVRWYTGEDENIECYVQPVPTSVVVGPDGYIYIGELTGALAEGLPIGRSRIWKLPANATHAVCDEENPVGDCNVLINGLTSVIDVEIGPDGMLYVVELDENSWFSLLGIPGINPIGGTISRYYLDGTFDKTVSNLSLPGAITFDKKGNLWVLENLSTVRVLEF
ncbi:ScyD/ScyE family protein [Tenacibaculum aestuarii]|uniref:ScyD/ScyE family protein n=1 Tax=Tenacibaculum aestuarii TaxID=362781 RepID=UPI0038932689